ncbi:PHO85 cyclin-1 [Basidiobolus ranarum]|uniref:PHO85 cyclin-1 n=1 Tax=Basidiobolus ranarum TaxID=34480 RepID=A0ABR2WGS8_9FUNG
MQEAYSLRESNIAMLMKSPITEEMIAYVTDRAALVIKCNPPSDTDNRQLPSPPSTPTSSDIPLTTSSNRMATNKQIPSLELFIKELAAKSKVHTPSFLCTVIYLDRLRKRLPEFARGMECTCHRIFLATLIIASKYLNDASPKNSYWARYTSVFSLAEVNLMERQLLGLLDFNLRITIEELHQQLGGLWPKLSYSSTLSPALIPSPYNCGNKRRYSDDYAMKLPNYMQERYIVEPSLLTSRQPRNSLDANYGINFHPQVIQNQSSTRRLLYIDYSTSKPSRKRPLKNYDPNAYIGVALKRNRVVGHSSCDHPSIEPTSLNHNLVSLPSIEHLCHQPHSGHRSALIVHSLSRLTQSNIWERQFRR